MPKPLSTKLPILILLALCLTVALPGIADFGISWDEPLLRQYGSASLRAYSIPARLDPAFRLEDTFGPSNLRNYGPVYVMLANLAVNELEGLHVPWNENGLWHLVNFLVFLIGVYLMWSLGSRLVGPLAALGTAVLFLSQPLLLGHAAINPKDIPFLTFFLLTMVSGLWMADHLTGIQPIVWQPQALKPMLLLQELRQKRTPLQWISLALALVCLGLFLSPKIAPLQIQTFLRDWVTSAFTAPGSFSGRLFYKLAPTAGLGSPAVYSVKAWVWYSRFASLFGIGVILWLVLAAASFIWDLTRGFVPGLTEPTAVRIYGRVLLAGAILGLSTSTRVAAPFAGILVCGYTLSRVGRRSIPFLVMYAVAALGTCYLSWPFLWAAPLQNFWDSAVLMSNFGKPIYVLFNGVVYPSNALPRVYFPVLFGLTLTEPALLLSFAGLVAAVLRLARGKDGRILTGMLLAWFVLPVIYILIARPPIYDNGRQFLFIYPPAFILGGLALDEGIRALARFGQQKGWNQRVAGGLAVGLILLAALPGVSAVARLHPYEYTYFNQLIGGQAGAFRKFDLDYWLTSYQEAARYLNQDQPAGAIAAVYGPATSFEDYPDNVIEVKTFTEGPPPAADFAVLSSRANLDQTLYPSAPIVYRIEREGAIFAVIKSLR